MNNVKKFRDEIGMTVAELAEKTGLSRKAIYDIENNETVTVKLTTANSISEALGHPIGEIFLD